MDTSSMDNGRAGAAPSSDSSPALRRWGGIITGFARTYSNALNASRAAIIDAVDGDDAVDTIALVNGHRGTDHAGAALNHTRSPVHPDCTGVDRIFIATTPRQFEALAAAVDAEVRVQ